MLSTHLHPPGTLLVSSRNHARAPWDAHAHISATSLPQPCCQAGTQQGAPCPVYPPVYAQMAHDAQDIHLPRVLQLLAPDPGGNEAAGAADARAAGQTQP